MTYNGALSVEIFSTIMRSSDRADSVARAFASLRPEALAPETSGIVELFNLGRDRGDVIPLWGRGQQG